MKYKLLLALILMFGIFLFPGTPLQTSVEAATKGGRSLQVCLFFKNPQGEVVNGTEIAGSTITIPGRARSGKKSNTKLPDSTFTAPLAFNTDLLSDVPGNDAECKTLTGLGDELYYGEVVMNPANKLIDYKYHDGLNGPTKQLSEFFPYSPEIFDNNKNNDDQRNGKSDGWISGNQGNNRIFAIWAQYKVDNPGSPEPTATPEPTQPTPPPPSAKHLIKVELAENANIDGSNVVTLTQPFPLDFNETTILSNFRFADNKPGKKFVWARYTADDGTVEVAGPIEIELVNDDMNFTSVACPKDDSGNVNFTIFGQNFGDTTGVIKSGDATLDLVSSWVANPGVGSPLKATYKSAPEQEIYDLTLTRFDGQSISTTCNPKGAQLSLGSKYYCPAIPNHVEKGVIMTIYNADAPTSIVGKLGTETVDINEEGIVERPNPTVLFEDGKRYLVTIETTKGLRRKALFNGNSKTGETQILNVQLPIGDIYPIGKGDGTILASDKSELNKEWGPQSNDSQVVPNGDFNIDNYVNTYDWSCMRFNYGQRDESLPKFPIPGGNPNNFSPAPSTSATGSPTAAPSASSGQNKLTICHSSGDSSDPYVRIVIDANQSNDHFNSDSSVKIGHENDLLLNGDVSCPTTFQSPIPSPTP